MNDKPENDDLVPIPFRVAKERKAAWVKQSRAEGKKLGDWIIERVEREPFDVDLGRGVRGDGDGQR